MAATPVHRPSAGPARRWPPPRSAGDSASSSPSSRNCGPQALLSEAPLSLQRLEVERPVEIGKRHGGEQRLAYRDGPASCSRISRGASSTMRPRAHHRDAVGHVVDHREIVGDEQIGEAQFLLQILEQVEDLRLHRDVERRDRLVADQQVGAERQRARDADALALAAGEAVRIAVEKRWSSPIARISALTVSSRRCGVAAAVDLQRLAQDVLHRHARRQRRDRILEHHLDLGAQRLAAASPSAASTSIGPSPPLKMTEPLSGVTARIRILLTVVLPQPLSPTRPRHSPRRMSKLTPSTARTGGLVLLAEPAGLAGGEGLGQVAHRQQDVGLPAARARSSLAQQVLDIRPAPRAAPSAARRASCRNAARPPSGP